MRIEIYDTTLRDGAQGEGVSFSLVDKNNITNKLNALGVDFIEGGYPLSNPKDVAYFDQCRVLNLTNSRICAFGMTRRRGLEAEQDEGMKALVATGASVITLVGKSWDLHVDEVLQVDRDENIQMIADSVTFCRQAGREVFYDAEHFFDGFRANPTYAMATLTAAAEAGANRLILCDTNGGSLPDWVSEVVQRVRGELKVALGIHTHNDCGVAIANTLAAVQAGCIQVQGTMNGIGERCGNADLTTIVANLRLKMGYDCLLGDAVSSLARLTKTSRYIYELANINTPANQPFVGSSAFAHKGGMHVHGVRRVSHSYEHIKPDLVGNSRRILVSELSGASNVAAMLGKKFDISDDHQIQRRIVERVQQLEHEGFQYEAATASFELLVQDLLDTRTSFWNLDHYRCVILKRQDEAAVTEAIVKLNVNDKTEHHVADGDGPVNALDGALRKCLEPHYPHIKQVHLRDYRVRVVNPTAESAAKVRVIAEFSIQNQTDKANLTHFSTIGVNENIVDASWQALCDAFNYYLIESS